MPSSNNIFSKVLTCLLFSGFAFQAGAQVQPQTQIPRENLPRPSDFGSEPSSLTDSEDGEIQVDPSLTRRELLAPLEDIKIDIKGFDVQVSDAELKAELEALLTGFMGEGKTFEDVSNAAGTITVYMQSELGYYLAYAYIPEQTIRDGVVQIAVLEGVLDEVEIIWTEDLLVDRDIIEAHLAKLKPGSVIRVSEVERVVFLLNDLRGLDAKFEIQRGLKAGTARLVVTPTRGKRYTGRISVDGNGSRFSGTYRANVLATIESPFGLGDAISLNHLNSTTNGVNFTLLGYSMPVGADGFKLGVNTAQLSYELPESVFPVGLEGEAYTTSVFGLYPFARSRNFNLFGLLSFEKKYYEDRVRTANLVNDREVLVKQAALSGDIRDSLGTGGVTSFNFALSAGNVKYNTARPGGLDDAVNFTKVNYGIVRLSNVVPNKLLLSLSARGQTAFQNLDVSEQCRVGGAEEVRAFNSGEGTGDSCLLGTAELRYVVPKSIFYGIVGDMTVGPFYDYGRVTRRIDDSLQPQGFVNRSTYSGYGLSLLWEEVNNFQIRMSVAWQGQGEATTDTKGDDPKIYFSANKSFN